MSMNITNPIYFELLKHKLISKSNLFTLFNRTRDKKINVLKDLKTKVIFLEKYTTANNYYSSTKSKHDKRSINEKSKKKIANIKILNRHIKSPILEDDLRRLNLFKNILKNKHVLDFGCGWGGFLRNLKNCKSLKGVELRTECINYIKKNTKIAIADKIDHFNNVDIITMFHVLEHIPYQINTLKKLRSKLNKGGKLIIEVPHAEDFLLLHQELPEFKKFSFWSEHLILHTYKSLKTILSKAGFKNIKIEYYQRYNFSNHMGWFLKKKPGGHEFFKNFSNKKLNSLYSMNLIRLKQTDTLIAIAKV